jgi:hypothetical protein
MYMLFAVIGFGVIIICVAVVAYSVGLKARKLEGTELHNTDESNILKLRALSPHMQEKIRFEYNKCLRLDDRSDPKFRNVKCD